MEPPRTDEVKIAVLEEQMKTLVKSIDSLGTKFDGFSDKIDDAYLKKEDFMKFINDEFKPVKNATDKLQRNLFLFLGGGGVIITLINWYLLSKH